MKPAESSLPHVVFDQSDAEAVLEQARRAADPDFYLQKATGRVLTKFLLIVGGLQVAGVFSWLILVFAGVVDATMNLDGFMVSQLVFFILSIAVGLAMVIRHIRRLKEETEELEPGVLRPLLNRLDPDLDVEETNDAPPPEHVDESLLDELGHAIEVRWSAAGTIDDIPYKIWELVPCADGEEESGLPSIFCASGKTNHPVSTGEKEALAGEGGPFSLHIDDGKITLSRRNDSPLLCDDDPEANDVEGLCAAATQINAALQILRRIN